MKKLPIVKIIIIAVISLLVLNLFRIVITLNVLPSKYLLPFIIIMVVIVLISSLLLLAKKKFKNVIGILLMIIITALTLIGINYGSDTLDFLKKAFNNNKTEITTYDVIVLSNSNIMNITDLENKEIGYLSNDTLNPIEELNKKVSSNNQSFEDLYDLYDSLKSKELDAILLDNSYLDVLSDDYTTLDDDISIIYTFDIKTKIEVQETKIDTAKPINIYVSGSDSRSSKIYNKSRSDVNMVLTINPNTHEILMTSIPRDYYVQVHGQTGLKDKLTHAGIYGIDTSVATVEDLLDIDIDYYVKVSFGSVVELVDLVGGIDITSEYSLTTDCKDGGAIPVKIVKGVNHLNGGQALSYARERHSYAVGDRQRIINQQQVLEATLNKIVSTPALLLKYDKLLDSLNGFYLTNIPSELITTYAKNQIDEMSSWKFTSNSISGSDASLATHTAPNSKRYVMIPYEKDVEEASNKIKAIIND